MYLTVRALTAFYTARESDPQYGDNDPAPAAIRQKWSDDARALAGLLGIDPAQVVVTADPDRAYHGRAAHVLTVSDAHPDPTHHRDTIEIDLYRFIPTPGTAETRTDSWTDSSTDSSIATFHLLGPCPQCRAEVPIAAITQLADLGHALTTPPTAVTSEATRWDPNHTPRCPARAGNTTTADIATPHDTPRTTPPDTPPPLGPHWDPPPPRY